MTQHDLKTWKGFRPIAFLAPLPDELTERADLSFTESHDDLDYQRESAFSGVEGTVFGLVSHAGAPVPGTQLLAHADDLPRGVQLLVDEALNTLSLSQNDVRWVVKPVDVRISNRVFLSWSRDDAKTDFARTVIEALAKHGFEPVIAESDQIPHATLEHLREQILQCSFVIISGSETPWTSYELGIANAFRKPTWRLWRDKLLRVREHQHVRDIVDARSPTIDRTSSVVRELITSLEEAVAEPVG
jgi:hypothetical protein